MSRDLNLHVGALKRRAGRFKTLLKQLLLMLHLLQMLSREQVGLIDGHDCCHSPTLGPLALGFCLLGSSSCDCLQHKQLLCPRLMQAGTFLLKVQWGRDCQCQLSCFHPSIPAIFPFKIIIDLCFWFPAACNFFLRLLFLFWICLFLYYFLLFFNLTIFFLSSTINRITFFKPPLVPVVFSL